MSYILTAYIVDFSDLKHVIGSKDDSLVGAVEDLILKTYDDDKDEIETQKSALRTIIMGGSLNPNKGSLYASVLWHICKVKGEELLPDIWGGVRWGAVEACGLEDLLTKSQSPFDLPVSRDIPHVGLIKRNDLQSYVEAAEERKSKSNGSQVIELLEEFIDWLQTGISKQKDMIFFYS